MIYNLIILCQKKASEINGKLIQLSYLRSIYILHTRTIASSMIVLFLIDSKPISELTVGRKVDDLKMHPIFRAFSPLNQADCLF